MAKAKAMKPRWLDRTALVIGKFTLCTSEAMFHAELKRLGSRFDPGPWLGNAIACVHTLHGKKTGEEVYVVCIDPTGRENNPANTASLLVHEATHLMQYTMRKIGEDHPSPEFQAYMMQNITFELFEEYARQVHGVDPGKTEFT